MCVQAEQLQNSTFTGGIRGSRNDRPLIRVRKESQSPFEWSKSSPRESHHCKVQMAAPHADSSFRTTPLFCLLERCVHLLVNLSHRRVFVLCYDSC